MIAYKAFHSGLVCRGYQFHMGLNTTAEANCAQNGFHCAANPLDCLSYYSLGKQTEFYIVNAGGDIDEDNIDSKISCTELTILKKLDLKDLLLHALAYMADHPQMPENRLVHRDVASANNGFAIARGIDPIAKGNRGDFLVLAKESPHGGRIADIALIPVDGETVQEGIYYNIDIQRACPPLDIKEAAR